MLIFVDALTDQGETITFKSKRNEVPNTADIQEALTKISGGIECQIGNSKYAAIVKKPKHQFIMINTTPPEEVVILSYLSGYHPKGHV